jgi:hypothetical protein
MNITTITDYTTLFGDILELPFVTTNDRRISNAIIQHQIIKEIYSDETLIGLMTSVYSINVDTNYNNFKLKRIKFDGAQPANKFIYSISTNKPYTHLVTNVDLIITNIYHSLEGNDILGLSASNVYILNIA